MKLNLHQIYKINSTVFAKQEWNLTLNRQDAANNQQIIYLAQSQAIDFVIEISGTKDKFIDDIIEIVFDNKSHFDRANKGFIFNGVTFQYLVTTTNGGKESTSIYASDKVHAELFRRIENDRNKDIEIVPAKLEAYRALTFSSSVPVPMPAGVIVVPDAYMDVIEDVTFITDTSGEPTIETRRNHKVTNNISDGFGLISPTFAAKWSEHLGLGYTSGGYQIRGSFLKGMLYTFDFHKFARDVAKDNKVSSVWSDDLHNDLHNIYEADILLTESMLKLWSSYTSWDDYMAKSIVNGYGMRVAKVAPEYLDEQRDTNYQFIQPLHLSDDDIVELIQPTINEIKDVQGRDWRKSIMYLNGEGTTLDNFDHEHSDISKALKVEPNMINDPFVRDTINKMISKRINGAKMGELRIESNFSLVSGDPYVLCQSIFKQKATGLLKAGQLYSEHWHSRNKEKVAVFRAPMVAEASIRVLDVVSDKEMTEWYKHMGAITIFNCHDNTLLALNTCDMDGDLCYTTPNPVILRNVRKLQTIVCESKSAKKDKVTQSQVFKSVKASFGNKIGSITNMASSMTDLREQFPTDSEEYATLTDRIQMSQLLQQNEIDKAKGIISKQTPKQWTNWKANKPASEDARIVADKKPYFFIYRYKHTMKEWKKFRDEQLFYCISNFGMTVDQLKTKISRNEEETEFLRWYNIRSPLTFNKSTMNRVCWKIEEAFKKRNRATNEEMEDRDAFDYRILMSDVCYTADQYNEVAMIYTEYKETTAAYIQSVKDQEKIDKVEKKLMRKLFVDVFKEKAINVCSDFKVLTNIVVELCYKTEHSKQFAWDICGEQIINNLLDRNDNKINIPVNDNSGDFNWKGKIYRMKKVNKKQAMLA